MCSKLFIMRCQWPYFNTTLIAPDLIMQTRHKMPANTSDTLSLDSLKQLMH